MIPSDRAERARSLAALLAVAVPACFYAVTCSPYVGVTDSAVLTEQMVRLDLSSHANTHNLTVLFGYFFTKLPLGEAAYRANLASAFLGTLAVILFTWLARSVLASAWLALVPAWVLMVSHSLWWHSTIAESYAMNAVLTVVAVALLERFERGRRDRDLLLLFGIAGLSFFNHLSMGILLVAAGVALVLASWGEAAAFRRRLPRAAAAFLAGVLPYGLVFLRDVFRRGDAAGVAREALGGGFTRFMFEGEQGALRGFFEWVALQFPSPFLLLIPAGIAVALRRPGRRITACALLAASAVNVAFFTQFATWDEFAFELPVFVVLAWFGVLGFERCLRNLRSPALRAALALVVAAGALAPPWIYAKLASSSILPRLAIGWRFDNRYTENSYDWAEFLANPDKRRYDQIAEFSLALFDGLPPDALFFDDDARTYGPLRYYQRRLMLRPDVRIELLNSWGMTDWGLDAEAFTRKAALHPARVFVVSEQEPYDALVRELAPSGFRLERFPLSHGRWVYEIVSPAPRSADTLAVGAIRVLCRDDDPARAADPVLDGDCAVTAEITFEPTAGAVPLHVEWRAPGGVLVSVNDAGVVPAGARGIAAALELPPRHRPRGTWEVSVWSRGARAGAGSFTLR